MPLRRNQTADPTLAELEAEISALKDQVSRALHSAEGRAHSVHRRLRSRASEMAEGSRDQFHMLGDMAGRTVHEAERYARSNPGMTLGAAAIFGVMVGVLVSSSRH